MRKMVIAVAAAAAAATLVVPASAGAACKKKSVSFSGDLAIAGGIGEGPGEAVQGDKAKIGLTDHYVATSDVTLHYRNVVYSVDEGTEFGLSCFRSNGKGGYVSGKGRAPLLTLGSGSVLVDGRKGAPSLAGVTMRYGLFHASPAAATRFRVDYRWVDVSIGKGRAVLEALRGPAVGFSPGSVAALQGTCQAGEKMIVDWKGVRSG